MHLGFSYVGLIYLIMLFAPNIKWAKNNRKDMSSLRQKKIRFFRLLRGREKSIPVLSYWCFLISI